MNKNIMGAGWRLGMEVDKRGNVRLIADEKGIEQSIRFVLGTATGERVMQPDFGCRIHELVYEPNTPHTWSLAEYYVQEALTKWEPRIQDVKVSAKVDPYNDVCMVVEINYVIRQTNSFYNLVYPFYLEQGEKDSRVQMVT